MPLNKFPALASRSKRRGAPVVFLLLYVLIPFSLLFAGCGGGGGNTSPSRLAISPSAATVAARGTLQLTTNIAAGSTEKVVWSIREGLQGGTVSAGGLYTAPLAAGTFHVVATSTTNPSRRAEAAIIVVVGSATGTIE